MTRRAFGRRHTHTHSHTHTQLSAVVVLVPREKKAETTEKTKAKKRKEEKKKKKTSRAEPRCTTNQRLNTTALDRRLTAVSLGRLCCRSRLRPRFAARVLLADDDDQDRAKEFLSRFLKKNTYIYIYIYIFVVCRQPRAAAGDWSLAVSSSFQVRGPRQSRHVVRLSVGLSFLLFLSLLLFFESLYFFVLSRIAKLLPFECLSTLFQY